MSEEYKHGIGYRSVWSESIKKGRIPRLPSHLMGPGPIDFEKLDKHYEVRPPVPLEKILKETGRAE